MPLLLYVPKKKLAAALTEIFDAWYPSVKSNVIGGNFAPVDPFAAVTTNNNVATSPYLSSTTIGYFNGASHLAFNDSDDFWINTSDATIEAWVYWDGTLPGGGLSTLWGQNPGAASCMRISIRDTAGTFVGYIDSDTNTIAPTVKFPIKQWTHVAFVKSGTAYTIYLNGFNVSSKTSVSAIGNIADKFYVGSEEGINYWHKGMMSHFRFTKAARYTANFNPTIYAMNSTDPLWSSVVLAVDFSSNTDLKGHTVTNTGVVSTSPKFDSVPMFFNGNAYATRTYVPANHDWWTSDYTLEMWVYNLENRQSATGSKSLQLGNCNLTDGTDYWSFGTNSSGKMQFYYFNGSTNYIYGTNVLPLNTWHHLALVVSGTTIKLYANGVLEATATISGTPQSSAAQPLTMGINTNSYYKGYITDVRITKGVARYNATSQSSAFVHDANTLSLLHFDDVGTNAIVDTAGNAWTKNGTALSSSYYRFGAGSLNNTSGNGIILSNTVNWNIGVGDYTIEFWFYNTTATDCYIFDSYQFNTGDRMFLMNSGGGSTFLFHESYNKSGGASVTFTKPSLNNWHHFAAVRRSGYTTVYLNGVAQNTPIASNLSLVYTGMTLGGYSASGAYPFRAYYDEFRFSNTARYSGTNFLPTVSVPTTRSWNMHSADYYSDSTYLLLDPVTISDKKGHTVNNFGVTTSTNATKYNSKSMYFAGGTSNYLSIDGTDFNLPTGDFTIEGWIFPTATGLQQIAMNRVSAANAAGWQFYLTSNGLVFLVWNTAQGTWMIVNTGAETVKLFSWTHVAVSYDGTTMRAFLNGVLTTSTTTKTGTLSSSTAPLQIGRDSSVTGREFNGYMDELRISKVCRYKESFPVPHKAFPIKSNGDLFWNYTKLLASGESANLEVGTKISATGVTVTNARTVNGHGNSWQFSNGLVTLAAGSDLEPGSGDFTVEFWFNTTSAASRQWFYHSSSDYWIGVDIWNSKIGMWASSTGSSWNLITSDPSGNGIGTTTIQSNTWYHVAYVRSGNVWSLYLNGVLEKSVTVSGSVFDRSSLQKRIGNHANNSYPVIGYVQDFRFTKAARYLGNFIAPSYQLPTVSAS